MKRIFSNMSKKVRATVMMLAFALFMIPVSAGASSPDQTIDFGTGGFTFALSDIMGSAWNFIEQFNTYVILTLALIVVPTLVGFIIWLVSKLPRFRKSS